jgi:hypothetical protein
MTTLDEVERAVAALAAEDLNAFRAWFERFDAERFDEKIAQGADAGKLDALAASARAEFQSGSAREL